MCTLYCKLFVKYTIYSCYELDRRKNKKLKELWGKGSTASQIAEIIGDGVSRNAVIGKAHRLSLSAKKNSSSVAGGVSSKRNNEEFEKTKIRGQRKKFRSLLIEKILNQQET